MIIKPEHFRYLKRQHGKVGAFQHDFDIWKPEYEESLENIYATIKPYIPASVGKVLDIGGGFSGITLKLHEDHRNLRLTVIDGLDDEPLRHQETINNASIAVDFLNSNGLKMVKFVHPSARVSGVFDLIYSFASYPFHIAPDVYGDVLTKNAHSDTIFIFEVRKCWLEWFEGKFEKLSTVFEEEKYERNVYVACRN